MKALFIGRFQPFHLGHLSALEQIEKAEDVKEIIIGVGSSQYSGTEENPYDFETRKKMIELSCQDKLNKKYSIFAIPDIHDDKNWVAHVKKMVGKFDVVYTNNNFVRKLFEEKGYEVRRIKPAYANSAFVATSAKEAASAGKIEISGTEIRTMMKNKNEEWKKFVPTELHRHLESPELVSG